MFEYALILCKCCEKRLINRLLESARRGMKGFFEVHERVIDESIISLADPCCKQSGLATAIED